MLLLIPSILLMMQRNTIKLLERIRELAARRSQTTIKRHALHLVTRQLPALILRLPVFATDLTLAPRAAGVTLALICGRGAAEIDRVRFLDVAEVHRVDAAALVGHDGGFGVAEQGPGGLAEEGVRFDVGGAGAGAKAAELVLDEQFADEGFA